MIRGAILSLFMLGLTFTVIVSCSKSEVPTEEIVGVDFKHDMIFDDLASKWDEAIPLGNGVVGALVWRSGDNLRLSLDRGDIWDERPMEKLQGDKWSYSWVYEQWKSDSYEKVQELFDHPYDRDPAPSKIPVAALEFDISGMGDVELARLNIKSATGKVTWKSGADLITFVHATEPIGWFKFSGVPENFTPEITVPEYSSQEDSGEESPVTGQDVRRLGYKTGDVVKESNRQVYIQKGWNGFEYQVAVKWERQGDSVIGCWSVSSNYDKKTEPASTVVEELSAERMYSSFTSHEEWWSIFWGKSDLTVPDPIILKQWYLEQYKFGALARTWAPPISLQGVWTADNGKLPPWKGDFHHDLNTQLSYWPAYSGNHTDLAKGFTNWLEKHKAEFKRYTKSYFGTDGLNVPGVTTLSGQPMGGWIQYSFGPTVSAWLGHHFYMQYRYTMDKKFLEESAYPWISQVALHFEQLAVEGDRGELKLPISSSPEIHDNSRSAWFANTTNFDLSQIRWTFIKAKELALDLGKTEEASRWQANLDRWPELTVDDERGLMVAPGEQFKESHRHFSHLLGFHPLGVVDYSQGEESKRVIDNTLRNLEELGSDYYTGYSFSWLANLYARAFDGEKAAESLKTFATCFCLKSSFHCNGDQSGTGRSKFTYRPFTLEGNFAYASGLQEMLIQSHTGVVRIFPATPDSWRDISFSQLRTEGAFLISAEMRDGEVISVTVKSEAGGVINIFDPFKRGDGVITLDTKVGEVLNLER